MPFKEETIEDAVIIGEDPITQTPNPDYSIRSFGIEVADNKVELMLNGLYNIYKQLDVIIDNPDYKHHVGNLRKYIAEVIDIGVLGRSIIANWSDEIDKQAWLPIDEDIVKKWDEAFDRIVIEAIHGMRVLGASVQDIGKVASAILDLHTAQIQKLKSSCFAGRGELKTLVDRWHSLAHPTKGNSTLKLFAFLSELIDQLVSEILDGDDNEAPVTPVLTH